KQAAACLWPFLLGMMSVGEGGLGFSLEMYFKEMKLKTYNIGNCRAKLAGCGAAPSSISRKGRRSRRGSRRPDRPSDAKTRRHQPAPERYRCRGVRSWDGLPIHPTLSHGASGARVAC